MIFYNKLMSMFRSPVLYFFFLPARPPAARGAAARLLVLRLALEARVLDGRLSCAAGESNQGRLRVS